ncbi:MAG: phage tail protein [Colwellia sp.]|nr:phage tail protein [Colwellia sp.]
MTQTYEEQVAELTTASNLLTSAVENKIGEIDLKISVKEGEVDNFLQNGNPETRYIQDIFIGGSKDYLYPVWWGFPDLNYAVSKISVSRHFSTNGNEHPLNPDSVHQAALLLEMEGNAYSWSGDANFLEIKRFHERYNSTASHPNFNMYCKSEKIDFNLPIYGGQLENNLAASCMRKTGLYLRGGGLSYKIIKNWKGDVAYHDGSDMLRRNIEQSSQASFTVRWYVEPIPLTDLLQPSLSTTAYSDPQ